MIALTGAVIFFGWLAGLLGFTGLAAALTPRFLARSPLGRFFLRRGWLPA